MFGAFQRLRTRAIRQPSSSSPQQRQRRTDWRTTRFRQFRNQFGRKLETSLACSKCNGPISEAMQFCPWCGHSQQVLQHETRFPQKCPRCHRGMKLDWIYCPWCFGPGFEVTTDRHYSDRRYQARCANPDCSGKLLMPFMRYCPWCRRKVLRKWKVPGSGDTCPSCGWGVFRSFWDYCAWCGKRLHGR